MVKKYQKLKQENKNLKNTIFNITKKENDKKEKGFRTLQIKYENRELEKKRLKIKKKKKITMIAISMITMLNLMMKLIIRNMKKW